MVTAFCPLTNERYAIGCREGVILICDKNGNIRQKLIGHQAAVTAISRKGNKLFSSSYDCTLRLWDLRKGKTESAVIVTSPGWIHTFCFHPDGTSVFIGDEQGGCIGCLFHPITWLLLSVRGYSVILLEKNGSIISVSKFHLNPIT